MTESAKEEENTATRMDAIWADLVNSLSATWGATWPAGTLEGASPDMARPDRPWAVLDAAGPMLNRAVMAAAINHFMTFLLVLVRISGLMLIGPLLGSRNVPMQARVLFVFTMALLVTPTIPQQVAIAFARQDINHDGVLSPDELPPVLRERLESTNEEEEYAADESFADWTAAPVMPASVLELAALAMSELGIGVLLGLGVQIVIGGMELAGQIIDQQSGFGLGEVFNPDLQSSASQGGRLLYWYGLAVFLLLEPVGGHLQLMRTLLETFRSIPVGHAWIHPASFDLLNQLVQSSLSLGLRFAAPLILIMAMVDLSMGFLTHTVPQINTQAVGYSVKAVVSFLILLTLFATSVPVAESEFNTSIERLREDVGLQGERS